MNMMDQDFTFQSAFATDKGCVRDHNEDSFLVNDVTGVWVVADGMGGHQAGDFASGAIVESVDSIGRPSSAPDLQSRFRDRVNRAHARIQARSQELDGATVGSTLVSLLAYKQHFACVWSGDSRAYLLRNGSFQQISTDHTEVQELLNAGTITPAEAETWPRKNVITRAIGVSPEAQLEQRYGTLQDGDCFLLCSDGLTEHVEDAEMFQSLMGQTPQNAANRLMGMTLDRGALDNVTIVIIKCTAAAPKKNAGIWDI